MAVYTEVPDDALEAFVASYDIGRVRSCKGIAEGVENSNFLLHTDAGHFILTLYEKRVNAEELPFFLRLMEHAQACGVICPLPVKNREGSALNTLAGRPAAIVTFLDGISVNHPSEAHCAALGAALAQFHVCTSNFPMQRSNSLGLQGWQDLAARIGADADQVMGGLKGLIESTLETLAVEWPRDLPTGIIHADLFPNNVLFTGNQITGVIDFYFACTDILAYDLVICLNAWCCEADGRFNLAKAQAMLAAYHKIRPISEAEIAAIPTLARGAALRFLLTRTYDLLHCPKGALVKPLDPLEYVKKLEFHNGILKFEDYGLHL